MTKKELLKDLFDRVLYDLKIAERCKRDADIEKDHDKWKYYQTQSRILTEELESIVYELSRRKRWRKK